VEFLRSAEWYFFSQKLLMNGTYVGAHSILATKRGFVHGIILILTLEDAIWLKCGWAFPLLPPREQLQVAKGFGHCSLVAPEQYEIVLFFFLHEHIGNIASSRRMLILIRTVMKAALAR
jgi:hypothetical protein